MTLDDNYLQDLQHINLHLLCTKGQPLKMIVEQFSAGVQKAP